MRNNDFSKIQNLSMFIMLMTFHALGIFSDNHRYIFTGVITLLVIERNRQTEIDSGTTTPMIVIYSTYQPSFYNAYLHLVISSLILIHLWSSLFLHISFVFPTVRSDRVQENFLTCCLKARCPIKSSSTSKRYALNMNLSKLSPV